MKDTDQQWHLKKEVNIAHVITTVLIVVSCIWYMAGLDKRIQANTQNITHIKEQRIEDVKRLDKQFDRINDKLDKLLVR